MSNSSWRPDEDLATIHTEDSWLQGALVMCIAYGSVLTLSIQCFIMLVKGFKPSRLYRDGPLLVYVVLVFILNTIYIGTAMYVTQLAFVDNRNFPGGPAAFEVAPLNVNFAVESLGNNCFVISTFLSDALLLWRCTVMYKNSRLPDRITIGIAMTVWLTEFILGVFYIIQNGSPTPILTSTNFALNLWCFSLALNIMASLGIVARILLYRWRMVGVLGREHTSQYTGVIAMIVESELLYTVVLILFIVPFVRGSTLLVLFVQSLALVQAIGALMIVYRVAQGQAWAKDTYAQMTASTRGSAVQLSVLHAAGSTTFAADSVKSTNSQVVKDF